MLLGSRAAASGEVVVLLGRRHDAKGSVQSLLWLYETLGAADSTNPAEVFRTNTFSTGKDREE